MHVRVRQSVIDASDLRRGATCVAIIALLTFAAAAAARTALSAIQYAFPLPPLLEGRSQESSSRRAATGFIIMRLILQELVVAPLQSVCILQRYSNQREQPGVGCDVRPPSEAPRRHDCTVALCTIALEPPPEGASRAISVAGSAQHSISRNTYVAAVCVGGALEREETATGRGGCINTSAGGGAKDKGSVKPRPLFSSVLFSARWRSQRSSLRGAAGVEAGGRGGQAGGGRPPSARRPHRRRGRVNGVSIQSHDARGQEGIVADREIQRRRRPPGADLLSVIYMIAYNCLVRLDAQPPRKRGEEAKGCEVGSRRQEAAK